MKFIASLVLSVLSIGIASAQQPVLVKDINTYPADYGGYQGLYFYSTGDHVFFPKDPGALYSSWWVSDGTANGTHAITNETTPNDSHGSMTFDGDFYFITGRPFGLKLMRYTPTTSALQMVKEFDYGEHVDFLRGNGQLMFSVRTTTTTELWKSDGTPNGTSKFKTLDMRARIALKGDDGDTYTYFETETDDYTHGIWRTDGTEAETVLLKSSDPWFVDYYQDFYVTGNDLYFLRTDYTINEGALWKSDGTEEGTTKLGTFTNPFAFTIQELNGKVIAAALYQIIATDGTEAGTSIIFNKGATWATIYNGSYYFIGLDNSVNQRFLGKSDGTAAGTSVVTMLGKGPVFPGQPLHQVAGKLLVQLDVTGKGTELGITDGTAVGTTLLKDIYEGPNSSKIVGFFPIGDKLMFLADDGVNGQELWITDGTTEGTVFVKDVNTGTADGVTSYGDDFSIAGDNKLVFTAYDTAGSADVWITDGTAANTKKVYDLNNSSLDLLGTLNGFSYYSGKNKIIRIKPDGTFDVVKSDPGLYYGTELRGGSGSVNGKMLFQAYTSSTGLELWISDGTTDGTHIVRDVREGPGSYYDGYNETIFAYGKLLFTADDGVHGMELWISDGTEAGTTLVADIEEGSDPSNPYSLILFKDKVYFFVDRLGTKQLWTTDGTQNGTKMVLDLHLDPAGYIYPNVFGDRILFSYNLQNEIRDLWKTDATADGTSIIKSFGPYTEYNSLNGPYTVGDRAIFYVNDGEHGGEWWTTDGTQAGTKIIDLSPGAASSSTSTIRFVHGLFYFNWKNGLWRTAGTVATTEKVADSETRFVQLIGEKVYLGLSTEELGAELYTMPFTKIQQEISFDNITDKNEGGADFTLTASVTSERTVTFTASPANRVSFTGNTVKILKPGSVTITASHGTDGIATASKSHTICIIPSKPAITLKQDKGSSKILQSSAADGNQWYLNGTPIATGTGATFEATADGNYTVSVNIDGCTGETSNAVAVTVTGLEEEFAGAVFPNPAKDKLYIQWKGNVVNASLIDTQGHARLNTSFVNNTELNVADLPTGLYILKLTTGDKHVIKKFIKE